MNRTYTHRRSAWVVAGILVTICLMAASTAAFAQTVASGAVAPGANPPPNASRSNEAPPAVAPKPDPTKPATARDDDKLKPETARDPQVMVPETARDDQKMSPETATDSPPPKR